jgi:hypothetical protein
MRVMKLKGRLTASMAVVVMLLVAAGCGSSSVVRSGARGTVVSDRDMVAFATCMRQQGVNVQDPVHIAGHTGLTLKFPTKTPATIRAAGKCERFIAPLVAAKTAGAKAQTSAHLLGLVRYAQCMREHGIPMLDPNAFGSLNLGSVPGIASVGRYTPLFRRADAACRVLLPANVRDTGTGP